MSNRIIISDGKSLPRDLDVTVNVSKAQVEGATDFSLVCFVTPDAEFRHDANRIRFYSNIDAVAEDFATSSEAWKAASAFFSQTPRAKRMAIARVFEQPVAAFLQGGVVGGELEDWKKVNNGCFAITIDGISADITGLDFSKITDKSEIAQVIQTRMNAANQEEGFAKATVQYLANGTLFIQSGTTGDTSSITKIRRTEGLVGIDISGEDLLNCSELNGPVQPSYVVPGYTPAGIESELNFIKEAAEASGNFVYGWVLDAKYRDQDEQYYAAGWAEAQQAALIGLTFNSPLTYDASSLNDVAALCAKNGYRRYFGVYHNNPYYYPEMSILAYALSVNYALPDSTITTKFKMLQGIPTVPVTAGEVSVLLNKRVNTYTAVGNNSRTFREGVTGSDVWYIDDLINLDNFREELQVAVYNVFLVNKKIPYTDEGSALFVSAMAGICQKYVANGTFAIRSLNEIDTLANGGINTEPAYVITMTPVADMTVSDRSKRIGPPAHIKVNLAGAIHSIDIAVEAFI